MLKGLSPLNDYLIDELESFIVTWPKKKWEIEKAAPTMENPPVVTNFFDQLEEKLAAVEEQLVAHAEARQKAEEEERLRAEEVESRKAEDARLAAELQAAGAGPGGNGGGGDRVG